MKRLWTKDFSLITAGTIVSAIGGEAISLPVSLLVFDETGSTFLSALLFIAGFVPDILLSVLIAPLIDRAKKKPIVVSIDILMAILFLIAGFTVARREFSFSVYMVMMLVLGLLSLIYRLAFSAWYPDLITPGLEQKGYAVSSTIYPTVMIVMAPVAAFLYQTVPIDRIFVFMGIMLLLSAGFKIYISGDMPKANGTLTLTSYLHELKSGFVFVKDEKGLRNIYTYLGVSNGVSMGNWLMYQAYFQTTAALGVTLFGFLRSAETLGRAIGGVLQYRIEVPPKKRYGFTKFVYTVYESIDMSMLFLPYPLMLVGRFVCGILGVSSATIREAAVQSYLPREMRARVNALTETYFSLSIILFQFLAGWLGEMLSYRTVVVILGSLVLVTIFSLIFVPTQDNKTVYEAVRVPEETVVSE